MKRNPDRFPEDVMFQLTAPGRGLCSEACCRTSRGKRKREILRLSGSPSVLAAEEVGHRQQTRIQRLTRRAQIPFRKTIDDVDFTYQSTLACRCSARRSRPIS